MKKILIILIIGLVLISGCGQTKYVCPDGTTVSDSSLCPKQEYICEDGTKVENEEDCIKLYCNIINRPDVDLRCESKSGNTYEYCTVYITPDVKDDKWVSYLMYESLSGTNKKEQVPGNYHFPFDTPKSGYISMDWQDEYNYYFKELIPDEVSNMFIIIPYDFKNEQHCENLKINLFFKDAKI